MNNSSLHCSPEGIEPIIIGTRHSLFSTTLGEQRSYTVSLPSTYHARDYQTKRYPVLVVLDGETNLHSTSGIVEHMGRNAQIPEMIVIGVPNSGIPLVNRVRDFTPTLAAALHQGADMKTAVAMANHAASISVTRAGAAPSMPTRQEVEQEMLL